MNIVILVRNYKPYNSAVGVCMSNISEIIAQKNNVIVICEKTYLSEPDEELIGDERIVRFVSKQTLNRKKIEKSIDNSSGLSKLWFKFLNVLIRICYYIEFIFQPTSIRKDLVHAFLSCLESIDEKIDLIVPACMPIEAILASKYYCDKHDSYYIPVLFDKFATNKTLQRFRINERIKLKSNIAVESELFKSLKCRRFLYTKSWQNHINAYHSSISTVKGHLVEHPLLKEVICDEYHFPKKCNFIVVFAGTLTHKGRDPEYALELFANVINKGCALGLYVFGAGDAMDTVKSYANRYPNNIFYMGQVRTDIAHSALSSADYLLSFGNEDVSQTASKIFEYMSYCKPIIHIARYKSDPILSVLDNYPNSFVSYIDQYSIDELTDKVVAFINSSTSSNIDFESLKEIYKEASPDYSANIILE